MRVAPKLSLSSLRQAPARVWLLRAFVAVLASILLLAIWHPMWVNAQTSAPKPETSQPPATQPPPTTMAPLKKRSAVKPLSARDTASTTHRVKAGETLWSIATRYYGDGHQWRAVARRNGIELTGEASLRAGADLVIPSPRLVATAAAANPAPPDTATPKAALAPALPALPVSAKEQAAKAAADAPKSGGNLAAQTMGKPDASTTKGRDTSTPKVAMAANPLARQDTSDLTTMVRLRPQVKAERLLSRGGARIGLVDADDMRQARKAREQSTIFLLQRGDDVAAPTMTTAVHAPTAPRRGEYASAPFAVEEAMWAKAGQVRRRADDAAPARFEAARMQLADEVIITPPTGATLSVGDQLVSVKRVGLTSGGTPVAFPTGVLEITAVGDGRLVRAFVRSESGVIEQGQALFPVEGNAAPAVRPEPVPAGGDLNTTVSWIEPTAVMPTLQSFVLLSAGSAQGVKAGDWFALVGPTPSGTPGRLAVVRVVRVGPRGSAAVVIKHDAVGVDLGVSAQRISRAP